MCNTNDEQTYHFAINILEKHSDHNSNENSDQRNQKWFFAPKLIRSGKENAASRVGEIKGSEHQSQFRWRDADVVSLNEPVVDISLSFEGFVACVVNLRLTRLFNWTHGPFTGFVLAQISGLLDHVCENNEQVHSEDVIEQKEERYKSGEDV